MRKVKSYILCFAVFSTAMFFTRCTFENDIVKIQETMEQFKVYVTTPNFETVVHFEFVDAKTNKPISESAVLVTVTGKDADKVYDNIGSKQKSYSSYRGILDLVIDPHMIDTSSLKVNPIEFEVSTSSKDYDIETKSVKFYDSKTQKVTISLINKKNPPVGIVYAAKKVDAISTQNGGLTNSIEVDLNNSIQNVNRNNQSNVSNINSESEIFNCKLEFSKGLKFKDIDNNYKSLAFDIRYKNFPEDGLTGATDINTINSKCFLTYGDLKLSITAVYSDGSQKLVNEISEGKITIKRLLPNNFINPETMLQVKANDKIGRITSISGADIELIDTVVTRVDDNRLLIQGDLGKYPSSLHRWVKSIPTSSQPSKIKVIFNFDDKNFSTLDEGYFDFNINNSNTSNTPLVFYSGSSIYGSRWKSIEKTIPVALPTGSGKLQLPTNHKLLKFTPDNITIDNMSEEKTYIVTVASSSNYDVKINLDLEVSSENVNNMVIKPTSTIYYYDNTYDINTSLKLVNGKASMLVMVNQVYNLWASLGNESATGSLKVELESPTSYKVSFTPQMSSIAVHSISVPKTDSKEINLKYQLTVSEEAYGKLQLVARK
jgi:hypothetical protein